MKKLIGKTVKHLSQKSIHLMLNLSALGGTAETKGDTMNQNNNCSLEMSRRLVEAGIEVKTEAFWIKVSDYWKIVHGEYYFVDKHSEHYPAPSMSELWTLLPYRLREQDGDFLFISAIHETTYAGYGSLQNPIISYNSTNPCDALAELLLWVEGSKVAP